MITTKQRAKLRGIVQNIDTVMQIGKDGVKDQSLKQITDMLEARELVKVKVLNNCDCNVKDMANEIASKIGCDVVQVIGSKMSFYKKSTKDDIQHIELD